MLRGQGEEIFMKRGITLIMYNVLRYKHVHAMIVYQVRPFSPDDLTLVYLHMKMCGKGH